MDMALPKVLLTIAELREACEVIRRAGKTVGVVPTMGFLHEGHRSLMAAARTDCDFVVVTIFVNPLQFGPNEDLDRYPRDLDADLRSCAAEGVDAVFAPEVRELYPTYPPATTVRVAALTESLCGASRPGHFDGVTTIVAKLFSIVGKANAYFGRKDAQQLAVVRRMAAELALPVAVIGCPLVREADGLAKSSRNAYLSPEDRRAALAISRALKAATDAITAGERDARVIQGQLRVAIGAESGLKLDYAEVCDAATIATIDRIEHDTLLAVAVFCGATRLIDNATIAFMVDGVKVDLGTGWVPAE